MSASWVVIQVFLVLYGESVDSLGTTDFCRPVRLMVLEFSSVLMLHMSPGLYSHSIYKDMFALEI